MAPSPAPYPRRLIEVDLPIRQISEHARREKSIRHGHISTLHLWWARRPLAACRAVILASLWPDPADPLCPEVFREAARRELHTFRDKRGGHTYDWDDNIHLRRALLAFIADFANWDFSNNLDYLATSRALVQVAHESLGGEQGVRPLVVDPFAGGGSIPLEALRVGADAFASDLNPVAVLLNRIVLEYIPKYGRRLSDEVMRIGNKIRESAERELAVYYPRSKDGSIPVTYLWARQVRCEGPGCGILIPMLRSLWLAKTTRRSAMLRIIPDRAAKSIGVEVEEIAASSSVGKGTTRLGAVTCPLCEFTTSVSRVREQLRSQQGGAKSARLVCVVRTSPDGGGRFFSAPTEADLEAVRAADVFAVGLQAHQVAGLPVVPNEPTPEDGTGSKGGGYRTRKYGITNYGDFFSTRQLVALTTLLRLTESTCEELLSSASEPGSAEFAVAVKALLVIAFDRVLVRCTANCIWDATTLCIMQVFNQGQSLPFRAEFAEMVPTIDIGSGLATGLRYAEKVIEANSHVTVCGSVQCADAAHHPLPDDFCHALVTDPPYYDAVPYAELSDFFFVWLKRLLPSLFGSAELAPKVEECVVDQIRGKDRRFYENKMRQALAEGRRILTPSGIGVIVFAHKSTAGWESMLQALLDAGWVVTASWPIDTESENRLRAQGSAALASSVHLVVRPRENSDGSLQTDMVGDWNDVLDELPRRIASWLPRLAAEGVVGADAIFACLGPALEIFSRFSRVEKASGDVVLLREYLERVWAEVARQALSMIFAGADTSGFEQDARLTAMWLWTLSTNKGALGEADDDEAADDDEDTKPSGKSKGGFGLEYDAARKIAQGLGASLEALTTLVEVKGDAARLLGVGEREATLFPKKGAAKVEAPGAKRAKKAQLALALGDTEAIADAKKADVVAESEELGAPTAGGTMLDQVHQAMLMFRGGRSVAMKRFLVEDGVGREERFWKLAQSLSALYPTGTEEKRWVDGVLARKKGLGL